MKPGGDAINLLAYVHLRNIHASTGAGRMARQMIEHLAQRDDIRLQVLADRQDKQTILPLVGEPWTSFAYETFDRETSKQQLRWMLRDQPVAEEFWNEAQVVYCTGESYVPTRSARLVVTAHDAAYFEPHAHSRDLGFWKTRAKWTLLFRKLARRADVIQTVSHFSAERLAHFFPALASRIRTVHNGVTPHFFAPVTAAGEQYLREQNLLDRAFVFIPGGLHFRKNADLILRLIPEILRQYPELAIVIGGHMGSEYSERVKAFAPRVLAAGFVSDEALRALHGSATVVWFPSRYEGFGLPIVEAMASGTPVVASNSSSIPEIAGDAALLCDPADDRAHLAALSSLLTDERARRELAAKGQERAKRFTWTESSAQLHELFASLL